MMVEGVAGDEKLNDTGTGVDVGLQVEDEIANAVVDGASTIGFYGLKRMGMMTDDGVGTGINDAVCLTALGECRLQGVFRSPVQTDEDTGVGRLAAERADATAEGVEALLTDTGFEWQEGEVLERQALGDKEPDGARTRAEENGLGGLAQGNACPDGYHASLKDVAAGVEQSLASLVYAVVVGEVQVSKTVAVQDVEPCRFTTKNEPLVDGASQGRHRTLQIAYDNVAARQQRVDGRREKTVGRRHGNLLPDASVEEYVAGEGYMKGIGRLTKAWKGKKVKR